MSNNDDPIFDSRTLIVLDRNGEIFEEDEQGFARLDDDTRDWKDISKAERLDFRKLYNMSHDDLLALAAKLVINALEEDPVGTMESLGFSVILGSDDDEDDSEENPDA
jgi:hypothetical protein